jgi:hypothetical protein
VLAEYQRALGEAGAGLRLAPRDEEDLPDEGWDGEPAAPAPAAPADPPAVAAGGEAPPDPARQSLEDVEKAHLRDSFWSVT